MLSSLNVRNYVLINSLEISFPEGLIIITGETGAGKSIIIGALSLVLGGKADASMIAEGSETCVVEAEFDIKGDPAVKDILDTNDLDWDGGHLNIRRVVNSSGRSRSFVNDVPVPVSVLSNLASGLIDIHSQHQTLLLSDKQFQMSILDHFAGNEALLADCRKSYCRLGELKKEYSDVAARIATLSARKEYDEAQFKQLNDAKLTEGELEDLDIEHRQLANAEEIKEDLNQVEELLSPSNPELKEGISSVSALLKESGKLLLKVGKFMPEANSLSERVESSRLEIDDILDSVNGLDSNIDNSKDRLDQVEGRMSFLYDLMKKHSCGSISELIAVRDKYSEALFDSSSLQSRKEDLEKEMALETGRLEGFSSRLHSSREKASAGFASEIQKDIRSMELDRAVFEVRLEHQDLSQTGYDSVLFEFSSSGRNPVEVSKCASGGEMSRIMLCLKAMMAKFSNMPTMIFDEIDTGVSGSAADKIGRKICEMGDDMQVFAITHLPQVAAKGKAHFVVTKTFADGKAETTIRQLSDRERINEIARMLSGATVTPAAIENAKSLLSSDQ